MSIKEALERKPVDRKRTIVGRDIQYNSDKVVSDRSLAIMKDSGALESLDELTKIVSSEFPDVKILPHMTFKGRMGFDFAWNFREPPIEERQDIKAIHSAFRVEVYPVDEAIIVESQGEKGLEGELLTKSQWSTDRRAVEDALVHAFKNPFTFRIGTGRR